MAILVFQMGGFTVGKWRISLRGRFRSPIEVQRGFRRSPGELLRAPARPKVVKNGTNIGLIGAPGEPKVRFESVHYVFLKELGASALLLCNERFLSGCFLVGCSVPRCRDGGITKLWFEVSVVSLALAPDAITWAP